MPDDVKMVEEVRKYFKQNEIFFMDALCADRQMARRHFDVIYENFHQKDLAAPTQPTSGEKHE
jgi:hypothetical protein